jgi:putative transposase
VQSCRPTAAQRQAGWLEGADPVLPVLRYVERNPLRAGLVTRADAWCWSSLFCRSRVPEEPRPPLALPPNGLPEDWLALVNRPQNDRELGAMRLCAQRGAPFGREAWVKKVAQELGLDSTLRPRGRPKTKGS